MTSEAGRQAVLTKTISDGRTAVITAGPHGHACVTLNGEPFTDGFIRRLPAPVRGMTHAIGGAKAIGLTGAEAAAMEAKMERITAEYEAARRATPEGQRDDLAQALDEAAARAERSGVAASNDDSWGDYLPARAAFEAAGQALDAFDAAHPELAARLAAEQARRDRELFESGMRA
ncbi:MAG TPA: hypothetical protein VK586_07195 [Streptosporangiaceae bacterium]|nr:hypothetical protein [Streptosporangiaceae bacterium]